MSSRGSRIRRKPAAKKKAGLIRTRPARAEPPVLLSPKAFGEAIGVTRTAVNNAIKLGLLAKSVSYEERGQRSDAQIDLEAGKAEWAQTTGPRKDTGETTVRPEDLDAGPPPGDSAADADEPRREINYAEERARKEMHLADRYELENAQRRGDLMDRSEVMRQLFKLGRVVRDGCHTIPSVLAPELVGLKSKDIAIVLERELNVLASKVADEADKIAGAPVEGPA